MSILIVLTNWGKLGGEGVKTSAKTGWYLPEVAHPLQVFTKANYKVDFMSPKGGNAPMDPGSGEQFKEDRICQDMLKNVEVMRAIANTKSIKDVKASDYKCIFFAGGHGPMWDMPNNPAVAKLVADMYESGRIVAAVCHGTVGFVDVKLKNGEYMIKDKKLTSFTNSEEHAVKLMEVMPFALETKLKERGAKFVDGGDFQCNVVFEESDTIVTGQNPASATDTAKQIVKLLGKNQQLNAL